ncbi:MAG: universal stress protein [Acidimicrobiia bacterium]
MRRIIVGFLDNPEGKRALDLAVEEAQRRQAHLVIVHSFRDGREAQIKEIRRYRDALEGVTDRLASLGIEHEVHEYVRGNTPAEDLLRAAKEFDAELIVIGYRRRSATNKALLGSHAHAILMGADCPVLAVVAPEE